MSLIDALPETLRHRLIAISVKDLTIGLGSASILVMLVGTCSVLSSPGELPPPKLPKAVKKKEQAGSFRTKPRFYETLIEGDARRLGLYTDPKKLQAGLVHRVEFDGNQRIKMRRKFQTKSLSLAVVKKKLWLGERGSFHTCHSTSEQSYSRN